MYGLIPENFGEYIRTKFGDEKWEMVAKKAGIHHATFGEQGPQPFFSKHPTTLETQTQLLVCCESQKLRLRLCFQVAGCLLKLAKKTHSTRLVLLGAMGFSQAIFLRAHQERRRDKLYYFVIFLAWKKEKE